MHSFITIALSLAAIATAAPQFNFEFPEQQVLQSSHGGEKYLPPATTTSAPVVHKQFYVVSAPEDTDSQNKIKHLQIGRPQKNYRVVFIKAPTSNNANVKYSAEFAPQEEKTVIYVLSKKENELNANDIATPPPTTVSKPEVFFIKYKTPEEAVAAQREIQNEYAKLEGTNEFSNEGTAPLTSVVGSLDGLTPDGAYNYRRINTATGSSGVHPGALVDAGSVFGDHKTTLAQYLPPNHRK